MASSVKCSRCRETREGLSQPPQPGALGREIQEHVCSVCWAEWERMEVMVINELRLNFMDPKSMEILGQQMREFFSLPSS